MARACPRCGRPNGDAASTCLYCTAPLDNVPREDTAPDEPVASDRHLVILLPAGEPEPRAVEALARLAGLSLYDARLSLSGRSPRVFRRLAHASEARELSRALAEAEIPHYAVAEASVLAVPVSRVRRLELRERHLALVLESGSLGIPYEDLLLLVRGEIERERHREKRIGSARGMSRRLTPGLRLHVYAREASVAAEIDPETFESDALGADRTASALVNLQKLLARIAKSAPRAELDRGFDDEPSVLSRTSTEQDVTRALAQKEKTSRGVVYDNLAQFRYYSRWRYRLCRHLASRDPATA